MAVCTDADSPESIDACSGIQEVLRLLFSSFSSAKKDGKLETSAGSKKIKQIHSLRSVQDGVDKATG